MMRKTGVSQITPLPDDSNTKEKLPKLVNDAVDLMQKHISEPIR